MNQLDFKELIQRLERIEQLLLNRNNVIQIFNAPINNVIGEQENQGSLISQNACNASIGNMAGNDMTMHGNNTQCIGKSEQDLGEI
ncbi:MAG: hypothetical protein Q4A81_04660 [Pasteurellaceae bacterium]|nr:hypothetical protein [Pasteurellaceae bacterium]